MNLYLKDCFKDYKIEIDNAWYKLYFKKIEILALNLIEVWKNGAIFICGNGGSAANANQLAYDFIYGAHNEGKGLKVHSLCSNNSILTC